MKKILTSIAAILLIGFGVQAQTTGAPEVTPAPSKMKFDKTEHSFGSLPQGKPVTYEFEFLNTGASPVEIESVKAACGCTTPDWTKEAIAPGQKGKVSAQYNMAREGAFRKSVTVKTKEGETVILYISGEAVPANNSVDAPAPSIITPSGQ